MAAQLGITFAYPLPPLRQLGLVRLGQRGRPGLYLRQAVLQARQGQLHRLALLVGGLEVSQCGAQPQGIGQRQHQASAGGDHQHTLAMAALVKAPLDGAPAQTGQRLA